ncbi:MAG: ATP-dependent DNA ligase [Alphaproteobacteria bacterium]|nr:ATP-dependent DNA ligase [Alphaproteobacteria bacterium]MBV9061920.1 ATP-dependent DNA ligase [Alphaproteobacteria bacterium]
MTAVTRSRVGTSHELAVPVGTLSMEAKLVDALPTDDGWQFEPKWDGFRCLAFKDGDEVALQAKSGKSLTRYFPEIVEAVRSAPFQRLVIDGELAIPVADSISFDSLQLRLHPAESRIRKLAKETPAIFILFDCLQTPRNRSLLDAPLSERRAELESIFAKLKSNCHFRLSPYTRDADEAKKWLNRASGELDGVVAKRLDGPYVPGERAMLKIKCLRTADCVVGGFRYAQGTREVGSLLLGLYNEEGKLDHVGFTSTVAHKDRGALTKKLEKLRKAPGFTGDAPGAPSRWSTERTGEWEPLANKLVVEVRYDHVTGNRFRHGTKLLRWRPDKSPKQCTFEQLQQEARPSTLVADVLQP